MFTVLNTFCMRILLHIDLYLFMHSGPTCIFAKGYKTLQLQLNTAVSNFFVTRTGITGQYFCMAFKTVTAEIQRDEQV
jgi:hypothetical protein